MLFFPMEIHFDTYIYIFIEARYNHSWYWNISLTVIQSEPLAPIVSSGKADFLCPAFRHLSGGWYAESGESYWEELTMNMAKLW